MSEKKSFLLLSLKEKRLKKIADTISSKTAQAILEFIAEKGSATETEIADGLKLPLSTVHYNIKNLEESSLISAREFHYSKKGREVNHYSLANRYIIIAPASANTSFRNELKGLLLTFSVVIGSGVLISLLKGDILNTRSTEYAQGVAFKAAGDLKSCGMTECTVGTVGEMAAKEGSPAGSLANTLMQIFSREGVFWWFIAGAFLAIAVYLIITKLQERAAER